MAQQNTDWLKKFEPVDAPIQQAGPLVLPGGETPEEAAARRAKEEREIAEEARKAEAAERERIRFAQEQEAGGGAKPTEAQQKTLTLLTRISGGAQDIKNVLATNPEAQQSGFFEALSRDVLGEGMITRGIAGADRRIITDAQADALDALLTLGTGAAYNEEQKVANTIAYFPQYGDTEKEIKIKRERLDRAIAAARIQAGPLAKQFDETIKPLFGEEPIAEKPPVQIAREGEAFLTAADLELQSKLSEAWARGATLEELKAIAAPYNQTIPLASQAELDAARAEGRGIQVTPTGREQPADVREQMGFFEGIAETVTGAERSTPEIEALPDWATMPEMNQMSVASFQSALATMMTSPDETAAVLKAQFPDMGVRQDAKGNFILRSSVDGREYAIKPGFRASDIPRALGDILAFTPAGRAATIGGAARGTAGTQAGIEAIEYVSGGEFNPETIAIAGAGGAGGKALEQFIPPAVAAVRGRLPGGGAGPTPPAPPAGGMPSVGGMVPEAPPAGGVPPVSVTPEARVFEAGEVVGGRGTGGAMATEEATIRAQRAAELPVPIELARFQRTRNFVEQQRARELAKNNEVGGPIRDRMAQQQEALRQNFERFIEGTGSQVWENPYEQGGVIADALGTLAKRERTKINALYKRAEKAGEMREPVPYDGLMNFINGQTATTRERLAPVLRAVDEQIKANDPNGTGFMTLNQMEDIRKLINKVASPGTPDASFGRDMRGIIDDITKDAGGDVYKQARQARAKYANDFENIDLVQKIFDNKPGTTERYVALEKVVDRIIGESAPLDSVNSLLSLLDRAGPRGERAKRELQGAVMEKIRDQAYRGVTRDESGGVVIQPAALNTIVNRLERSGKIDAIFDKKTAELLRTINDVTADIVTAPPGSVNASGTSSAIMNAIDTVATFGTTGIPVPAAKILNEFRKALATRQLRKEVKRLLD